MEIIASTNRHQIAFSSLEDFIAQVNVVRVLEAFVGHIDLKQGDFVIADLKIEGRPAFIISYFKFLSFNNLSKTFNLVFLGLLISL